MSINFYPKPAQVLICNFETGFVPPEMVKLRRVVILSSYQLNKRGICTVVPLSTTTPNKINDFHFVIQAGKYKFLSMQKDIWVKADMITTISIARLDRICVGKNFLSPSINNDDFNEIRRCVRNYLDFQ
jgi:uncharacterized protein YifN (PemK superfamily)